MRSLPRTREASSLFPGHDRPPQELKPSDGGVEQRAGQEDEKPQRETRDRRASEPAPSGSRALPQRHLNAQPRVTIADEQDDEPHLDPEDGRGCNAADLGQHHHHAARENEGEAGDHPAVKGGEAIELAGRVWPGLGRETERRRIRSDGHAAPQQDAAQVEVRHRCAHGSRPAIEVRPKREQMRHVRRNDHGPFLLGAPPAPRRRCDSEPAACRSFVTFPPPACQSRMDHCRRPHAPRAYSPGNNPAARGVLTRRRTATPRGPVGAKRPRAIRSDGVAAPGRRLYAGALPDAQRSRRAGRRAGCLPACAQVLPRLPRSRAWLLAIVRNTAYTWQRRHRADGLTTEFDEELHSDAVAEDHPGATLERDTARESLHRALDRLPPEFREVIVLRELEGMSYKEIGDVTGVPIGTVMSRLSRARRRLQEALCAGEEGQ